MMDYYRYVNWAVRFPRRAIALCLCSHLMLQPDHQNKARGGGHDATDVLPVDQGGAKLEIVVAADKDLGGAIVLAPYK